MDSSIVFITTVICVLVAIFLGLLISKIDLKLSWKQVIIIKYKVLIIAPLINTISNCITRKKQSLGKLYKIRNKLMNILTQS